MKTIKKNELKEKIENEDINLIEVLSEKEFNKEHIKDILHISIRENNEL